jgi:hypothetical protein
MTAALLFMGAFLLLVGAWFIAWPLALLLAGVLCIGAAYDMSTDESSS